MEQGEDRDGNCKYWGKKPDPHYSMDMALQNWLQSTFWITNFYLCSMEQKSGQNKSNRKGKNALEVENFW